jgi:outer membrane beta-barrel protein
MRRSILLATLLFAMNAYAAQPPATQPGTVSAAPEAATTTPISPEAKQAPTANDAPAQPDFDSLGGNTILLERARALEPDKDVSIVQQRTVDRRGRVEFAPEMSSVFGGQVYTSTKALALNANYHFTPRFSVGVKYSYFFNTLSDEGNALMDNALADYNAHPQNPTVPYPQLDWAKDEVMALANWYPLYGKINWFDKKVVHFDIYGLAGYGQVNLKSGSAPTYTAGGGIGFWFNPHLSTRLEMRYQTYTAQYFTGAKDLDLTVGSFQVGWML